MVKTALVYLIIMMSSLGSGCAHLVQSSVTTDRSVFLAIDKADQAYQQSRWAEAERYYREVINKVSEDHYAWFRLGNTQLRQGLIESAIYTYKQAEKRHPRHAKTQYNLAMSYLLSAQERLKQSGAMLRADDPGKIIVQQKIAELHSLLERPEELDGSPGRQPLNMN